MNDGAKYETTENSIELRIRAGSFAQVPSISLQSKTFTLAFWAKGLYHKSIHPLFGDWPSNERANFLFLLENRRLKFMRHAADDTFEHVSSTSLNEGTYTHVAVTWTANKVTTFINGMKTETIPAADKFFEGVANTGDWFDIGRSYERKMDGYIFELYLMNEVLSEEQIYKLAFKG